VCVVCAWVCHGASVLVGRCMCVCVCVCVVCDDVVSECASVREIERERDRESVCLHACVFVCICV